MWDRTFSESMKKQSFNHGGQRPGAGRPCSGRVSLSARIQARTLQALSRRAARLGVTAERLAAQVLDDMDFSFIK